jgi:hypothetical protein
LLPSLKEDSAVTQETSSPEPNPSVDDKRIEAALHALLAGDPTGLAGALAADPELVNLAWQGNTLLEWATQPPHGVADSVVQVLIDHGAHLDRALNLAGCWNLAALCRRLLAAGADPSARADADITPLESAAFHGSAEAADVLVEHGLHRPGLWLAAACGRLDLVGRWVGPDGALIDEPGPYRPRWSDVGRPPGEPPSDQPSEIIGEALVFAGANGRVEMVDHLLGLGADINARPYRNTTGLHLAVQFAKLRMVRHLIDRGADLGIRDDEHHGDATGWARACADGSPDRQAILAALADADPAP